MTGDPDIRIAETSFFSRLSSSFAGIGFGFVCLIGAIVMLFWNEGRAVQTARSLDEGAGTVQSVAADRVDPAHNGQLVHVSGPLATTETLSDTTFGVSVNGIRLIRTVEMYQWQERSRSETQTRVGGGQTTVTTYSYETAWSASAIDSSRFNNAQGRRNPPMQWTTQRWQAAHVSLGAFALSPGLIGQVGNAQPLPATQDMLNNLPADVRSRARLSDGQIYIGFPDRPQVGDYRIRYEQVQPHTVSIVAQQQGNSFAPYQTRAGDRIAMLQSGDVPAEAMFQGAQSANTSMTWILRGVGLVIMFIGFRLLFGPIAVLGTVLPVLGSIVGAGVGLVAGVLALVVTLITIAIAWLYYRPILAVILIVVGIALLFGASRIGRQRQAAGAAPPPPPKMA